MLHRRCSVAQNINLTNSYILKREWILVCQFIKCILVPFPSYGITSMRKILLVLRARPARDTIPLADIRLLLSPSLNPPSAATILSSAITISPSLLIIA